MLLLSGTAGGLSALSLELSLAQTISLLALSLLGGGAARSLLYCVLASDLSLVLGSLAGLLGLAGSLLSSGLLGGGLLGSVPGSGLLLGGAASSILLKREKSTHDREQG